MKQATLRLKAKIFRSLLLPASVAVVSLLSLNPQKVEAEAYTYKACLAQAFGDFPDRFIYVNDVERTCSCYIEKGSFDHDHCPRVRSVKSGKILERFTFTKKIN